MNNPFDQIRLVEVILALVVIEAVVLTLLWRFRGIGVATARLLPTLAAGGFLLLALRDALAGAAWHRIWLWLALSLVAHGVDLVGRWRRRTNDVDRRGG